LQKKKRNNLKQKVPESNFYFMYIAINKYTDEYFTSETLEDFRASDIYIFEWQKPGWDLNESIFFIDEKGQRSDFRHSNYTLKKISYPHDGQYNNYHFVFTFEYSDDELVQADIKLSTITKNQFEFPKALAYAIRKIVETDDCDYVSKQLIKKLRNRIVSMEK